MNSSASKTAFMDLVFIPTDVYFLLHFLCEI